jgi:hypothetical protein
MAELEGSPLLLNLSLPRIMDAMSFALVGAIHAEPGLKLGRGSKLFDLTVDLSAVVAHDCPPISYYRIAMLEPAWLRRLLVAPGDQVDVGAPLALFSTEPEEPLAGAPVRDARITLVGILHPSLWGEDLP